MSAAGPGSRAPWDPGAQPERTRLAWQRTALSGLAASLVVGKLIARHSTVLGIVLAALAIAITAAMLVLSRIRYHRSNAALFARGRLPDARVYAATTALIVLTALGAAGYTLLELVAAP